MWKNPRGFLPKFPWKHTRLLFLSLLSLSAIGHGQSVDAPREIGKLMSALYERSQFNGAVLVARQGKIIYKDAFGKANFQTHADFTVDTPSDIGSVTKQFTAMSIMILEKQKKLNYDEPVSKYISELSHSARFNKITLRHLLTHSSGIPDYGDLDIDDSSLDQNGLIATLLNKEDAFAAPGLKYRYSNPGYALLAIVVERVSGEDFGNFLHHEIFTPLGMSNTYLYAGQSKKMPQWAIGYGQFGQVDDGGLTMIPGDGGVYSTVDDLFKWAQALYAAKLVGRSALVEAFTPGKVQEGTSSYGFGWNVGEAGNYLWHTGSHAGFRAFIALRYGDQTTVVILTNKGNSKRQDINSAVQNILSGKPYGLPKQSGAQKLYSAIHESGIDAAMKMYDTLKNDRSSDYDFGESELNTLGYQLLYGDKRARDAIAIFKLNTLEHPTSSNAFDSLGEAYRQSNEKDLAISSYRTAVQIDPTNGHAAQMLSQLEK